MPNESSRVCFSYSLLETLSRGWLEVKADRLRLPEIVSGQHQALKAESHQSGSHDCVPRDLRSRAELIAENCT